MKNAQVACLIIIVVTILLVLDVGLAPVLIDYHVEERRVLLDQTGHKFGSQYVYVGTNGPEVTWYFTESEVEAVEKFFITTLNAYQINKEKLVLEKEETNITSPNNDEVYYNLKIFMVYDDITQNAEWSIVFAVVNSIIIIATTIFVALEKTNSKHNVANVEEEQT